MINLKRIIMDSRGGFIFKLLRELVPEILDFSKYLSEYDTKNDKIKFLSDLTRRLHALEKGMSIGNVKVGFGQAKALDVLDRVKLYYNIYNDVTYTSEAVSILKKYVEYNHFDDNNIVVKELTLFLNNNNIPISDYGGIIKKRKLETISHENFEQLASSRCAVRDFSEEAMDYSLIEKALKICEKTPSACNRQSWRIHVFNDKTKRNIAFKCQGGSKGFYEDMQSAILVCSDIRGYALYENNLPYVDGGLYAMNLIYALHYLGLATIPLTMSVKHSMIVEMKKLLNIPKNEVPVLLIGVGTYKDNFKVAASNRNDYKNYTTFN